MPLYDFVCTAGHKSEAKAGYDVSSVPCPDCGKPAQRSAMQNCIGGQFDSMHGPTAFHRG